MSDVADGLPVGISPLPGGLSGETWLTEVAGERAVLRIYAGRSRRQPAGRLRDGRGRARLAGPFHDRDLGIDPMPEPTADLARWLDVHAASLGWPDRDLEALRSVVEDAQSMLDEVTRVCLVHSDMNSKNLLVDPDPARTPWTWPGPRTSTHWSTWPDGLMRAPSPDGQPTCSWRSRGAATCTRPADPGGTRTKARWRGPAG